MRVQVVITDEELKKNLGLQKKQFEKEVGVKVAWSLFWVKVLTEWSKSQDAD